MSHLKDFIAAQKERNAAIGFPSHLPYPSSPEACGKYFDILNNKLSPEMLYCDGERSNEEAKEVEQFLYNVWSELEDIVGHPVEMEN